LLESKIGDFGFCEEGYPLWGESAWWIEGASPAAFLRKKGKEDGAGAGIEARKFLFKTTEGLLDMGSRRGVSLSELLEKGGEKVAGKNPSPGAKKRKKIWRTGSYLRVPKGRRGRGTACVCGKNKRRGVSAGPGEPNRKNGGGVKENHLK